MPRYGACRLAISAPATRHYHADPAHPIGIDLGRVLMDRAGRVDSEEKTVIKAARQHEDSPGVGQIE